MSYQTVRDLITHVRSLHQRLAEQARNARERADDERTALVLAVIDEHEATLERAIRSIEKRSLDAVLDTWLQFTPQAETDRVLASESLSSSKSNEDVVTRVLATENSLLRLYQLLQGSSGSPSVQSFFASLLVLQDSATRRAARIGLETRDA